jgi:predicted permease
MAPNSANHSNLAIVATCSAVPASSSAHAARQMGGDAPLLAQIITLQTILAAITMPVVIALAATGP